MGQGDCARPPLYRAGGGGGGRAHHGGPRRCPLPGRCPGPGVRPTPVSGGRRGVGGRGLRGAGLWGRGDCAGRGAAGQRGARTWPLGRGAGPPPSPGPTCLSPGPTSNPMRLEEGTPTGLSPLATTLVRARGAGGGGGRGGRGGTQARGGGCGGGSRHRVPWGTSGALGQQAAPRGPCQPPAFPPPPPDLSQLCGDKGGFDAAALTENGTMLFFRGTEVWETSPRGPLPHGHPLAASWLELEGPVDAALRIHRREHPEEHQNLYLFQGEQVWAYAGGQLRPGFPRRIGDEFPGVPGGLDAAVECHPEECGGETILFFKGDKVFSFDLASRMTKQHTWPWLGPCDAALRWLERYYCLQGTQFQRFDPVTGEVPPGYPRDLRDYFIPCPGRGGLMFRLDSWRDGWHAWPQGHSWPGLQGDVDAAFAWDGRTYLIQGSQVSIYLSGQGHRQVEGYPKALQDELGVPVADAAFTCPGSAELYVIAGDRMRRVDLTQTPRHAGELLQLPHDGVDGAMCTADGIFLFRGDSYYQYRSVDELLGARQPAPPQEHCCRPLPLPAVTAAPPAAPGCNKSQGVPKALL
uniref:Hemopexin n=1 Tax=Anas platyrhynchos platyrhynchos TaxID=8840 RepID=A0A493U4B2_ANAPP